ncbi:MAG: MBL fold metallo-hydrolase [Porticoccaceae bacterium]|nr:MBL fold metallo-hydrolase [Porticoccaceae bacterium]MBT3799285.1 MBL fold metallo-hydrolase [Porticoccaceae bacterium]MBT4163594.1 MBL fold metallo-hydrolase [Porticoccaceae bacterium]MBT4211302.1 MBL fold metallo-hydrolase [Porticoccaceae bacterium]MBT4591995.1 MBL fold metallo-hydrolase [Porticoccaceae bacterium]
MLTLTTSASFADHHQSSPSFTEVQVTSNILMLQGKGGNLALLSGGQGLVLVDDDYQEMSAALTDAIADNGGLDKLTYIINTHWHGDHTGGNLALGGHATIVAHDNVRTRLLSAQEIKLFNMKSEPYPEQALPSVTYTSSLSLHINEEHVELIHLANGHTDGDSVVFFKNANVVHMGDHFFNGMFPFVDVGTGGNVFTLTDNIDRVLDLIDENTKVIPGHGPLANKKDLQDFHTMLVATSSSVKMMAGKGQSLDQIQAAGLGAQWSSWTKGVLSEDVWISIIHNSL